MQIWIDGDACPNAIKTIIFKAAERTKTQTIIVANRLLNVPKSPYISRMVVSSGFDEADNKIVDSISPGDLVITADIPLADSVIEKQGIALNPRGQLYTSANIKQILAMRDFNASLRDCGLISGGDSSMSAREIQTFSNHLDKLLTQASRGSV